MNVLSTFICSLANLLDDPLCLIANIPKSNEIVDLELDEQAAFSLAWELLYALLSLVPLPRLLIQH